MNAAMEANVVVFRDESEEPITVAERKVLHRCGLIHTFAVNDRWHTDYPRDSVMEVLDNVRQRGAR